jgi:hypothetical protein
MEICRETLNLIKSGKKIWAIEINYKLSNKRKNYKKKKCTEHKMCIMVSCKIFVILRRNERDMIRNAKYLIFSRDFNES